METDPQKQFLGGLSKVSYGKWSQHHRQSLLFKYPKEVATKYEDAAAKPWMAQVMAQLSFPLKLIHKTMDDMLIGVLVSLLFHSRKLVQFVLTANIFALYLNITSACLTGSVLLTAVQLFWVNMIIVILRALQLSNEPPFELAIEYPYKDSVKCPPIVRTQNFFSSMMWRTYIVALILDITSACLTGSVPLTAVQLFWVNMIMVILRALALEIVLLYEFASETPYKDSVKRPPILRTQNFFSNMMWRTYIVELILNITSACLIGSVPLIADELFWENMIMVILRALALALASEPPYKDSVKYPPIGRTFSNILWPSSYHFTDFWFQAKGASILWLSLVVLNTPISYTFLFCQAMAQLLPLDKHTQVKHLRITFDEVIAVTGFGTNDARALHEADVRLAMGIAGTEGIVDVWMDARCKGVTRNFSLRDLMHYHTIDKVEAVLYF